jgi:hypothetical protein
MQIVGGAAPLGHLEAATYSLQFYFPFLRFLQTITPSHGVPPKTPGFFFICKEDLP